MARVRGEVDVQRLVAQGLQLGEGVFVGRHADIDPDWPWLITIEDEAVISPYVIVIAHDASVIRRTGACRLARVVIGRRAVVGAGAIILPGTRIGEDSIVGAGAVVRGEIPPGSVVVGNPGRVLSDVDKLVAWQRAEQARSVTWPFEGWCLRGGITEERKRVQRQTLDADGQGFLARPVGLAGPPPLP